MSRVRVSAAVSLSRNNLGQVVRTHVPLSHSSIHVIIKKIKKMKCMSYGTGQEAVMPCGWEGNRRSGVALAMCHRL